MFDIHLGSGRVVFVNTHSYYAAVTANYLMIECDKFCKVVSFILRFISFLLFSLDSNRSIFIR
jgi:hypothetical protein